MAPLVYLLDKGVNGDTCDRLDRQHDLFQSVAGDLLPACIRTHLDALDHPPAIADIGTGTGVWLRSIAAQLPSSVQLDGFDICATNFPATMPPNVRLMCADLRDEFDTALHGRYDVVHLRLLSYVLAADEWLPLARNVRELLRPGGFCFWEECSYPDQTCVPLTEAWQRAVGLDARYAAHIGRDLTIPALLPDHMEKAGYVDCNSSVHTSFRLGAAIQDEARWMMVSIFDRSLHGIVSQGGFEWLHTDDQVRDVVRRMYADGEAGHCAYGFAMVWCVGRTPST